MQQLGQRQMNRFANRGGAELMRRQHIDDLAASADDADYFAMIDDSQRQLNVKDYFKCEKAAIPEGSPISKQGLE